MTVRLGESTRMRKPLNVLGIPLVRVCLVLTINSCATNNYEVASSDSSNGYRESRYSENVFLVTCREDDPKRASDFAMLRAADLTLANGCNWFELISAKEFSETETSTTPVTVTPGTTIVTPTGADPSSGLPTTTTTTTPPIVTGGQTTETNSATVQYMVKILSKKPDDASITVFDAQFLSQSIRKQYGIDPTRQ